MSKNRVIFSIRIALKTLSENCHTRPGKMPVLKRSSNTMGEASIRVSYSGLLAATQRKDGARLNSWKFHHWTRLSLASFNAIFIGFFVVLFRFQVFIPVMVGCLCQVALPVCSGLSAIHWSQPSLLAGLSGRCGWYSMHLLSCEVNLYTWGRC